MRWREFVLVQVCSRKCAHANSARARRLCKCARGSVLVQVACARASAMVRVRSCKRTVRVCSCDCARASVLVRVCWCKCARVSSLAIFPEPFAMLSEKTCPSSSPVPNRSPHRSVSKGHNQNLAITSRVCPRTCRTLLNGISAPIYGKGGFPLLP